MIRNLSLTIVVLLIAFFTIFGRNGLLQLREFSLENSRLQNKIQKTISSILEEKDKMYGIKNSPDYLEHIAREEHGLSKSGEIIYVFDPSSESDRFQEISK